jgi:hypothetical protein
MPGVLEELQRLDKDLSVLMNDSRFAELREITRRWGVEFGGCLPKKYTKRMPGWGLKVQEEGGGPEWYTMIRQEQLS